MPLIGEMSGKSRPMAVMIWRSAMETAVGGVGVHASQFLEPMRQPTHGCHPAGALVPRIGAVSG